LLNHAEVGNTVLDFHLLNNSQHTLAENTVSDHPILTAIFHTIVVKMRCFLSDFTITAALFHIAPQHHFPEVPPEKVLLKRQLAIDMRSCIT